MSTLMTRVDGDIKVDSYVNGDIVVVNEILTPASVLLC